MELKENDVALVFGKHGLHVHIPKEDMEGDEPVGDLTFYVTALAFLISEEDEGLKALIEKKMKQLADEHGEEEENENNK